jgi:molybdopterin molybdotransferase
MLLGQAAQAGALPRYLGIANDRVESLKPLIDEGLQTADVLVLTGGVSAGKLDLVPDVLRDAGVTAHFHKIRLKPGKPLFFGTMEREGRKRLVFGLPGNPVSSFVCFELFLRPALRRLAGHREIELRAMKAPLTEAFAHDGDRPTYYPAWYDEASVTPVPWLGSSDLRAFLKANALLVIPPGKHEYQPGDMVDLLRL